MNIFHRLACVAVAALLPATAWAQSANFRLAALPGNIQGCIKADPQFTRVHVFTVKDGEAEITAAGGIHLKMKLTRPSVYEGDYALGSMHMHYVADLAAAPPTLNVSEKYLGCKWTAKKE